MARWIVWGGLTALLAAGCGSGTGPVTVTGAVVLDGRPVGAGSAGTIRFQPADPAAGRASEGYIADGRYEARVFPGRYDVTISWEKWPDKAATKGQKPPPGFDEIPPVQQIPAHYTKAGALTVDVSADKPQVDFSLVTK